MSAGLHRGQTMLLFALTLMLVALMVCMTISIGVKAKERMELQVIADTAAYSNAVVTARVFNEISLMNRAQTAQMVSMAGVQSLISWSGYHRANIERTRRNYGWIRLPYYALYPCCIPGSGCRAFCRCARRAVRDINRTRRCLDREQRRIQTSWNQRDQAAGDQAGLLQSAATALWGAEVVEYGRLMREVNNQSLTQDIVREAARGNPWNELSAPSGADRPSMNELMPMLGAVQPVRLFKDHHISAAMGSRGFTFTTTRGNAGMVSASRINEVLQQCNANPDTMFSTDRGSAYWSDTMSHGNNPSGTFAWADDHGMNLTMFNRGQAPCPPTRAMVGNVTGSVKSTDSSDDSDQHRWSPQSQRDNQPPERRHTMGPCVNCPGMWPMFVDYNFVRVVLPNDNYGQPRLISVVQRNYRARNGNPDPWNLLFNFRFTRGGPGEVFDNRGIVLRSDNGGGLDISRQTAAATGIAYYHRGEDMFGSHWREPPNFLNPFWRATLVPHTVEGNDMDNDGGGDDDIDGALNGANVGWAAEARQALERAGFEGWQ